MTEIIDLAFPFLALLTFVVVPLYAWIQRGRTFAMFSAVVMALSLVGAWAVHIRLPLWLQGGELRFAQVAMTYGMAAAAWHYAHLVRARMRGRLFRWTVSVPGQTFIASSFLATFWMLILAFLRAPFWFFDAHDAQAFLAPLDGVPYVVGVLAACVSARPLAEIVHLDLAREGPVNFGRLHHTRSRGRPATKRDSGPRPLRVVQITDPHLGSWQPIDRLRTLVEDLVSHDPDLVLLTGDFLTMESNATPGALAAALAPLRQLPGRCYAIFGNHDHEAPDEVRQGLAANGVRLLMDEGCIHQSPIGPIQIIGADYTRHQRTEHLAKLMETFPARPGHLRLLLLHDPSAFHDLPDDAVDLVFSGHTHGGQVGLVSLGLDWTVLSRSRWPDHGLFARGRSRLYVHRGTGFYGFPLRLGVPGEASVMEITWPGGGWDSMERERA
ncbi:MAG: metallophosphoesterase [Myxococcota bacterium]|nr:metallophosphoesterase [Myxococcota bacterium]